MTTPKKYVFEATEQFESPDEIRRLSNIKSTSIKTESGTMEQHLAGRVPARLTATYDIELTLAEALTHPDQSIRDAAKEIWASLRDESPEIWKEENEQ